VVSVGAIGCPKATFHVQGGCPTNVEDFGYSFKTSTTICVTALGVYCLHSAALKPCCIEQGCGLSVSHEVAIWCSKNCTYNRGKAPLVTATILCKHSACPPEFQCGFWYTALCSAITLPAGRYTIAMTSGGPCLPCPCSADESWFKLAAPSFAGGMTCVLSQEDVGTGTTLTDPFFKNPAASTADNVGYFGPNLLFTSPAAATPELDPRTSAAVVALLGSVLVIATERRRRA
jgi:hypothetical protein